MRRALRWLVQVIMTVLCIFDVAAWAYGHKGQGLVRILHVPVRAEPCRMSLSNRVIVFEKSVKDYATFVGFNLLNVLISNGQPRFATMTVIRRDRIFGKISKSLIIRLLAWNWKGHANEAYKDIYEKSWTSTEVSSRPSYTHIKWGSWVSRIDVYPPIIKFVMFHNKPRALKVGDVTFGDITLTGYSPQLKKSNSSIDDSDVNNRPARSNWPPAVFFCLLLLVSDVFFFNEGI